MRLSRIAALQHVNWNPDARELRRFAVAMLAGFGIAGLVVSLKAGVVGRTPLVLWSIGFLLALSAFVPMVGRCVYVAVYVVSGFMGAVVSGVLLLLMYGLVFVPLGGALRLKGKDLLSRRTKGSMWRTVEPPPDARSYYRQF